MKQITRQDSQEMVSKILQHDSDMFAEFYKQYDRIIWQHARKWQPTIQRISMCMYEIEDIHNELWEHVWRNLPKYDSKRANLVSWFYLICNSKAGILYRNLHASINCPKMENMYLYETYNTEDDEIEFIDMIIDPSIAFDEMSISEIKIYDYIYILKKFIEHLSQKQKIVYLQSIKHEMTELDMSNLLGISQSYINRIKNKLMDKAMALWDKIDNQSIDHDKADAFALALLGSETDDDLSDKLHCDLGVIKICREVLSVVNLYVEKR